MATETTHPPFLLSPLVDVSSMFGVLACGLRDVEEVVKVERQCDIVGGDQPSIEWLLDAELASADSLSWRLRLSWSGESWVIEADTCCMTAGAPAVEQELAPTPSEPGELESDLLAAAAGLVRARPCGARGW
jgi:hypothetical protein